ncbi:MAG: hypothetical protein JWQ97_2932, partial [Phenylobacterium sp.]|nr:hypothetical protein [Phenylobacterium sp.]
MPAMLKAMGRLYEAIGFEVVHNETDDDFITSDNPVVYFDPDVPEADMLPYTVRPGAGRIEFLLPLTPRLLLRGRSEIPM